MKAFFKVLCLFVITVLSCSFQKAGSIDPKVVYESENLVVRQLSKNVYQHISYLNTETYGKVPCNGMVVKDGNEAVIFDTPSDDTSSAELIKWIKGSLNVKINAVIATHFHNDCVGGLKEFRKNNIPSYGSNKTIALAKKNKFNVPDRGFDKTLTLHVGKQKVYATFFGEGHTRDNVVGYFPNENVMFGGCLVKEVDATKGYLEDSNVKAWSETVEKVKKAYPDVKIVIPGHGEVGGQELLDYTIKLFKVE